MWDDVMWSLQDHSRRRASETCRHLGPIGGWMGSALGECFCLSSSDVALRPLMSHWTWTYQDSCSQGFLCFPFPFWRLQPFREIGVQGFSHFFSALCSQGFLWFPFPFWLTASSQGNWKLRTLHCTFLVHCTFRDVWRNMQGCNVIFPFLYVQ